DRAVGPRPRRRCDPHGGVSLERVHLPSGAVGAARDARDEAEDLSSGGSGDHTASPRRPRAGVRLARVDRTRRGGAGPPHDPRRLRADRGAGGAGSLVPLADGPSWTATRLDGLALRRPLAGLAAGAESAIRDPAG